MWKELFRIKLKPCEFQAGRDSPSAATPPHKLWFVLWRGKVTHFSVWLDEEGAQSDKIHPEKRDQSIALAFIW